MISMYLCFLEEVMNNSYCKATNGFKCWLMPEPLFFLSVISKKKKSPTERVTASYKVISCIVERVLCVDFVCISKTLSIYKYFEIGQPFEVNLIFCSLNNILVILYTLLCR